MERLTELAYGFRELYYGDNLPGNTSIKNIGAEISEAIIHGVGGLSLQNLLSYLPSFLSAYCSTGSLDPTIVAAYFIGTHIFNKGFEIFNNWTKGAREGRCIPDSSESGKDHWHATFWLARQVVVIGAGVAAAGILTGWNIPVIATLVAATTLTRMAMHALRHQTPQNE